MAADFVAMTRRQRQYNNTSGSGRQTNATKVAQQQTGCNDSGAAAAMLLPTNSGGSTVARTARNFAEFHWHRRDGTKTNPRTRQQKAWVSSVCYGAVPARAWIFIPSCYLFEFRCERLILNRGINQMNKLVFVFNRKTALCKVWHIADQRSYFCIYF